MKNSSKTNELTVSHKGNEKLGPKISVLSRPVGDTCPNSCEFLDNSCYAERIERIYPNTRVAYLKNLRILDWQKIRSFLLEAKKRGNSVRLHQNGDWARTNSKGQKILDTNYLNSFKKAFSSIDEPPKVFFYTHLYNKKVAALKELGISCFASVSTSRDYNRAKEAGFDKFAWATTLRKGKDTNKKWEAETGEIVPVCWEQLGNGKTKDTCSDCGYCIDPKLGSIAFMNH